MENTNIYVLKLEHNKYYIGRSNIPENRIIQHFTNNGSTYTKIYKPIAIKKIFNNCDMYDEDKYTKIYMNKYGIDNVRGGSYTQQYLSSNTRAILEKEMRTANNECFRCGRYSHFANNCYAKTDVYGNKIILGSKKIYNTEMDDISSEYKRPCVECGIFGHDIFNCNKYANSSICYRYGRSDHWK